MKMVRYSLVYGTKQLKKNVVVSKKKGCKCIKISRYTDLKSYFFVHKKGKLNFLIVAEMKMKEGCE